MKDILQLLKGSDVLDDDLAAFMRANIVFWLLGATDGHAKNFSIFLSSGGRFRMTPLYDVLSAQPSLDANQIQRKQFKLAMSVGKSRHYAMDEILPRHFIQTAETAGVAASLIRSIFKDLAENAAQAIGAAIDELPDGFPEAMTNSIQTAISHRIDFLKAD
jgi:serine/threonine-protein kinase HipA